MNPGDFFSELKRRNVYKVAVAYAVIGWLLIQIATQTFPFLEIPNWAIRLVMMLVVIGFPISLLLAWAFELTPQGIKRTESADATGQHSRGGAWIFIVVVGVILSLGLFWLGRYTASKPVLSAENRTVAPPSKSVAVLPFVNLSRDPDNAYFAAGIQDEIITRLSKIGELKVVSCLSTQRFKSAPDDLPAIANQLGVANILQGSVQRTADAVRVNVQLIKAETDNHLWADTFDRKLTDVFQIESEIAKAIAEKLQTKLSGSEERAISTKPTADLKAHQLYLQGRYLWNRRTADNLKKALAYFQEAVEKDPSYALAYAGIADTYAVMPAYSACSPQECLPRARTAAEKALELDDSLAEAHASLGFILIHYFEVARSKKEFERAIELNPNYATAHQWYARSTLLMTGEFDHAIAEAKRAIEVDPVSPIIHADLGGVYSIARRYHDAVEQLRKTLEIEPEFYWAHRYLGVALELEGATAEAIAEYQKAFELSSDPIMLGFIGHAEAARGRPNEARQLLNRLTQAAKTRYVPAYAFAVIYLALGEKDEALDWLEKNVRDHASPVINLITVDPYLDPLRGDPRFEDLVAKVLSNSMK
ncbi:MAG TPA: tetratricopeptide repeat protein [Chthoniobacterales bacterium]|nr:tetratricopeptide repeat protein [Chthoniobacterales bacterium]